MLKKILRLYASSNLILPRLNKQFWISFDYCLSDETVHELDRDILLRLATETDIAYLEDHPECGENIVRSAIRFWRKEGFRNLYLGFFNDEKDPTIFQYVIDHTCNQLLDKMEYGGMYRKHTSDSVTVENIYMFKHKRKKNAALRFVHMIFRVLHQQGKQIVYTHIPRQNKLAMIWARSVGFKPNAYICRLTIDLPVFRSMKSRFFFIDFKEDDWDHYPLKLFSSYQTPTTD